MREIKFRAWLGKMMWEHGSFDLEIAIKDGGCELMQYTGLKDKKGKEILEGDILDGINCSSPYIVAFDESFGSYGIEIEFENQDPNTGAYEIEKYTENLGNAVEMYELEVVGNIYENPELLND